MPERSADAVPGPALDRRDPGSNPHGLVLMLHGGTKDSLEPVGPGSGSLRRAKAMQNALAPRLITAGHAVWLLRYRVRGWNAQQRGGPSPIADARWALSQVREQYGEVPVVLLGHSMGGRTSVRVADDPNVIGVVGLAPWFDPADPVDALAGKSLVAGHGLRDRITSARNTHAYVERARAVAASAEFVPLGAAGHYMLYRPARWNRFALRHSLHLLADRPDRTK